MRHHLYLGCALLALTTFAPTAFAQMGGGMGGEGMGGQGMGGGGRGGGGHHRGGGQSGDAQKDAPPINAMPAPPPQLPVAMRLTGVVNIIGESKAGSDVTLNSDKPDVSVIFISRGGSLTLKNATLTSHSTVSLLDDSRGSGLNSALLLNEGSSATLTGGSITTTGSGGNAAFVVGPQSRLDLQNLTITTRAGNAYGVEASAGAQLNATGLTIHTEGDQSPAIASQGGAPMTLSSLILHTMGPNSPLVLAGGDMTGDGLKGMAERSDGLAVEGAHKISLSHADLQSANYAVSVSGAETHAGAPRGAAGHAHPAGDDQDMDGPDAPADESTDPDAGKVVPIDKLLIPAPDAAVHRAELDLHDSHLAGSEAALLVSNARAHIVLTGVTLDSPVILRAAAGQGGELGRNGGEAELELHGETLTGDFATDVISSIRVSLLDQSHLTGKTTTNTDVTLDAGSDWILPGDTHVGKLVITGTTAPDAISNIQSGGHTLYYDPHRNPWLAHKSWPLPGGGQLTPDI
ncbi:hypothetical protein [Asticcacaulis sp. EMRT-3]|uniref:hypothetical protein n=1 Tax=Asticcacaulis sp. EMRT-3 TaxID=3040349 RepID=UPI0024AF52C5|nr:hypothetical protein [Asticcacaulis sp. EMRT-3]MDI7775622.1 hypothetical protein [Asticcacaulis sp. EMRT-3]